MPQNPCVIATKTPSSDVLGNLFCFVIREKLRTLPFTFTHTPNTYVEHFNYISLILCDYNFDYPNKRAMFSVFSAFYRNNCLTFFYLWQQFSITLNIRANQIQTENVTQIYACAVTKKKVTDCPGTQIWTVTCCPLATITPYAYGTLTRRLKRIASSTPKPFSQVARCRPACTNNS